MLNIIVRTWEWINNAATSLKKKCYLKRCLGLNLRGHKCVTCIFCE
uniref:Uncharacterized protein n=1 Tax=Anguilla anguilla TaxID=7936 RepID=A0A0E9XJF5_ANGAN